MQISVHQILYTYLLLYAPHLTPSWNKGVIYLTYLWQVLRLNPAWMKKVKYHGSQSHPSTSFLIYNFQSVLLNSLKTKRRLLYLETQFVPRSKHFSSWLKNQSVYDVSGTSHCLFSDKYKTHKYSVGRAYSC